MKISVKFAVAAAVQFTLCNQSYAQAPRAKNTQPVTQATPAPTAATSEGAVASAPPGWIARCSSASRASSLECAIEQSAVLTKTGQLIVLINIRVPAETRTPIALVQLPLGLNLPAGAKFQVDDGKTADLQIQTCEARGCYANLPISSEMLTTLKSGKQLKVSFQNLAKETITIPMPLGDFAAAYEKIK
ncbi:invasion associated locus B family protein [Bradyrhizobium sp. CB3481]|uniref:invasion associated locus B family protein n=1 Tax=Bradyrhizobium sp. CB3481 TaxID=3039158 RepID=UPI0024B0EF04|nr:invasion associated locus B family protein [Bradyrhizobium sp. CB3481]WFU14229.1 invasion associated locus B family protein [Bradyrhizobium sp. CB3481]